MSRSDRINPLDTIAEHYRMRSAPATVREGCWTSDPTAWRGRTRTSLQPAGFRDLHRGTEIVRERVMEPVTTEWKPLACGMVEQQGYDSPGCNGCALRGQHAAKS